MIKKKRNISVLTEVAIFFLVGIIIAGLLTYFFELNSAGDNVIRQAETLNKNPDASPKEVLASIHADVDDFVKDAEQFDDLTMLSLKYKG